ncbi:diguanylate cyclase [Thiohalobacter sp. COW1]|uniref:diguanylate cyclase n=1 Tax=Thiohalobacter thiocyanaticus TaxID=585455 RepID=A0A1Z4VMU1_9GAMM|nr:MULTISPECIES: diguanylate cyclase [Thiohalobacter]BAZ92815.1 diguanylate cyclase [Thiohalobacter thiocyanaticus]BCO32224.1 diguanylate cyclase [Thiohalobacter sp. COW1]
MENKIDIKEIHWLMDMLQTIDVGLVVLDRDYRVQMWNSFMENHSGLTPAHVMGNNLFNLFGEIPEAWFKRKLDMVFELNTRAFTTWEQRPYLLKFRTYRPISSPAEHMYQNVTLIPVGSADGRIRHVGIIIYDVTDTALGKRELEQANAQLAQLSRTDRLTGLNNRGYWEECLHQEFARFQRSKTPCSLIMFDIDHFKAVNDTHGHQAGDEVIRVTAATLRETIRTTDIAGRYGGEEFAIILTDTDAACARYVAERLRRKIEALTVKYEDKVIDHTISLGVAELGPELSTPQQWLEQADQALYRAKEGGRNRSELHSDPG